MLDAEAPRVLTIPMLAAVLSDRRKLPARNTLFRWVREQVASGVLRPISRGLYLNQLAAPRPTAAEAAGFIRTGAIVSLQTVLGEAGITNNFPDVVTSVVPHERGHVPSVRPVKAADVEFRFHSMPARLLDDRAGRLEDRMDLEVKYPRATPEKALLDWLYLGESAYSRIAGPPLDVERERLGGSRLRRLAHSMELTEQLRVWQARKKKYDHDPDVRGNTSNDS
ncbi:MAG: hypothetical protein WBW93_09805 [Steroidobacteraceae bacterium]